MKKQVLLVQFTLKVNCLAQCRTRSPQWGLNVTANASVQNSLQTEPQSVQDRTVESSTKAKVIGRFIHKTKTHCFTKIYDANLKGGDGIKLLHKETSNVHCCLPKAFVKLYFS